jgi:hypothetical protein
MYAKVVVSILMFQASTQSPAPTQTLADAAREARENKSQSKKGTPPKVYTNDSLNVVASDDAASAPATSREQANSGTKKTTALQWKAAIASQKNVVTAMQAQIDKTEKSIQFVTANGYSNGPAYNAAQKRKQDEVELEKARLEQEKQKLEALKEAARKAGFGSAVYDQ